MGSAVAASVAALAQALMDGAALSATAQAELAEVLGEPLDATKFDGVLQTLAGVAAPGRFLDAAKAIEDRAKRVKALNDRREQLKAGITASTAKRRAPPAAVKIA